jgi:hypothetical protein
MSVAAAAAVEFGMDQSLARLHPALALRYAPTVETAAMLAGITASLRHEPSEACPQNGGLYGYLHSSREAQAITGDEVRARAALLAALLAENDISPRLVGIAWRAGSSSGCWTLCEASLPAGCRLLIDPATAQLWRMRDGEFATLDQLLSDVSEPLSKRICFAGIGQAHPLTAAAASGAWIASGVPPEGGERAVAFQWDLAGSEVSVLRGSITPSDADMTDLDKIFRLPVKSHLDVSGGKLLTWDAASGPEQFTRSLFSKRREAPALSVHDADWEPVDGRHCLVFRARYGWAAARSWQPAAPGQTLTVSSMGRQLVGSTNGRPSGFYCGLICVDAKRRQAVQPYAFKRAVNDLQVSDGWVRAEYRFDVPADVAFVRPYAGMNYAGGTPDPDGAAALAWVSLLVA